MSTQLYQSTSDSISKVLTNAYSTSFSMGIRALAKRHRTPIYGIYGFVRLADEIVDTFHEHDKESLLDRFEADVFSSIEEKVSLNPILQSFQFAVNQYDIDHDLIRAFLKSMRMDLNETKYHPAQYKEYIYGSAEVVGLMCLKVFLDGKEDSYQALLDPAKSLGAAFQKVNFLRDLKSDFLERGRVYFPNVQFESFSEKDKAEIEHDISRDFEDAYDGILALPRSAKLGVYTAYVYYLRLFQKIRNAPVEAIKEERLRIPNARKVFILLTSAMRHQLNLL